MKTIHRLGALFAAGAAVLATALPASAHIPVMLNRHDVLPQRSPLAPDGTTSFAFYGTLDHAGDMRTVNITLKKGQTFYFQLLIPDLAPETQLATMQLPRVLVIAPSGAVQLIQPTTRTYFYEPYTKTEYFILATDQEPAEQGTYTLITTGLAASRFVVATGLTERRTGTIERAKIATIPDVLAWYHTPPAASNTPRIGYADHSARNYNSVHFLTIAS